MLSRAEIAALVEARHGDPFAVLGMHSRAGTLWVRALLPGASSVTVIERARSSRVAVLEKIHEDGLFQAAIPRRRQAFAYRLRVDWNGQSFDIEDPYRFPPVLGDLDLWLLAEGKHLRLYEKLGAHPGESLGVTGCAFSVWAPNAQRVAVVGDFNQWDGRRHPMRRRPECGVWEIFLPGVSPGARYKYEIRDAQGGLLPLKSDPFALASELRPATASVVATSPGTGNTSTPRGDGAEPARVPPPAATPDRPVSIYEVHTGSWQRHPDGRFLNWNELADRLLPYVSELGFTHVEFLPITEHPFDGSWGYQPTALYAPTARHGAAADFALLVERFHAAGIGVILDWVPGHFPSDEHALARFDGTSLYEHADPRQGRHPDWGTLIYNFGRHEVRNFLTANALFWIERYGVAGLRVDAVASMLYLDYSRGANDWIPNPHGGRENLDAVQFLQETNARLAEHPATPVVIAEESTAWPRVSRPVTDGGLGFHYKWNMGWMHDTLEYMRRDPVYRRHHQDALSFGLMYAFNENFILPLSHDEVVHGKGSLLGKMPGDRWQQFANLRLYYGFMWAHPGKKLLFMGGEFAQHAEWNHDRQLDWHLLEDERHRGVQRLIGDLNRCYREHPALHQCDAESRGFQWIDFSDHDQSVIAFARHGRDGGAMVIAVCNFTPVPRMHYRIGVPRGGRYREILNTDSSWYGGSNLGNAGHIEAADVPWHGFGHSVTLVLPPLACLFFAWSAA